MLSKKFISDAIMVTVMQISKPLDGVLHILIRDEHASEPDFDLF